MRCLPSLARSKPTRAERFANVSPGSRRYIGGTNFGPLVFSPPRSESTKTSSKDTLNFRRKSTRANYNWSLGLVPKCHGRKPVGIYLQLLGDGKAFVEFVCAFLLSLGFQLAHRATCHGGGCLTRHSHYVRLRVRGITIWRIQCTTCKAVFTVLPHFVLRYRQIRPEVARDALLATHGGLSLELCAVLYHISPMALYRLICAFGHQSLVPVLIRCGLPLPVYFLADEKHSRALTAKVYLPTIVCGRVIWHLGYTEAASTAAFTQSYGEFQQAALQQDPSYRVRGILTDGFDSTTRSLRTLFPGARLGNCLRHAINKLPGKLTAIATPVRKALRTQFHTLLYRARQSKGLRVFALGQRLRHFVDHVAATAGPANGARVRRWVQEKKAGWYAVLADPQMPVTSTLLDQAHNAIERKLFAM